MVTGSGDRRRQYCAIPVMEEMEDKPKLRVIATKKPQEETSTHIDGRRQTRLKGSAIDSEVGR